MSGRTPHEIRKDLERLGGQSKQGTPISNNRPTVGTRPIGDRKTSFAEDIVFAFQYPFRDGGLTFLIIGTIFFWTASFFSGGLLGILCAVLVGGFISAFMIKIIRESASNSDDFPGWPDVSDIWSDIIAPLFLIAVTCLVSFLPAIIYSNLESHDESISLILVGFGGFYLPMGLLAIAMFNSVGALNPFLILGSIFKAFGSYLAACLFLGIAVVARLLLGKVSHSIPYVGGLLDQFVSIYLLTVEMFILGALYWHNRKKLAWFE